MANRLKRVMQIRVLHALAECNSIRAIERQLGVHRDTIMRLGVRVGNACEKELGRLMINLNCRRLQVDELWGFIRKKSDHANQSYTTKKGFGSVWTFVAMDTETKLVPSYRIGARNLTTTRSFLKDLAKRVVNVPQLTSDALQSYADAVDGAFGPGVHYAQNIKKMTVPVFDPGRRLSVPRFKGAAKVGIVGNPDPDHISTALIERLNNTIRNYVKRLARYTLAFSKKLWPSPEKVDSP